MYVPEHFNEPDIAVLHDLIARHPLGVLITHGSAGLDANHVPFHLDKVSGSLGVLHCHVARNNPVWQSVLTGDQVLVVFKEADAYVSPQFYPSKQVTHKQVPTWNYKVVHAHGRVTIRDDERYVRGLVARLTRMHEAGETVPWKMTDSPADFINTLLTAIVGIEIEVTRLEGKFKLSQNKDVQDMTQAGQILKARGAHAIGDAMLAGAQAKTSE
ncbi:MAG: FMN-binding negative transcriptional regulator [Alcaligenaceae bacterium]|nr:MAG: FMN-binding negative transcriptional regulator [Alcaligenaceae bacterium]